MPFQPSRCVCLETPHHKEAVAFYTNVLGLNVVADRNTSVELDAYPIRLFIDKGEEARLVFEFLVPDVESAREELLKAGCSVVKWEGRGKYCYLKDPFGLVFNLYEES